MSHLFESLKSGTLDQHQALERLIDPVRNFGSKGVYKCHLLKTLAFYGPFEDHLESLDWGIVGLEIGSRRKTQWIEEDLVALGVEQKRKECVAVNELITLPFAVGCLYVVEGATLGGRVISRHLAQIGIGPANGGRFFEGYGSRTAEMWRSFQVAAKNYCLSDKQIEEAVAGAQSTFRKYGEALAIQMEGTQP